MFTRKALAMSVILGLSAVAVVPSVQAGGLFGDVVKWVGDRTGVQPVSKLGQELDNASRDIKKEVPLLAKVEEAYSRPVRETGKWAEENKETVAAVAIVAAAGWAACMDGCTFVGSLLVGGVAIPVIASDSDQDEQSSPPSTQSPPPSQQDVQQQQQVVEQNTPEIEVYPYYKRDGMYDFRPPTSLIKGEYGKPAMDAEVAMPTKGWEMRKDGNGHIFASREPHRAMRRFHQGVDVNAQPGDPIYATMTGYIERPQNPYSDYSGLTGVRMRNEKGFASGIFYVELSPEVKQALDTGKRYEVTAGVTQIGVAQNPADHPKNKGVEPHVHAYWEDPMGRKVSPDGKVVFEAKPTQTAGR